MNARKHPELMPSEGLEMDIYGDVRDEEEEEEKRQSSFSENGLQLVTGAIKMETEEMDDGELSHKAEKDGEVLPKEEETEVTSEDGLEERLDEERTEEDDDEADEEGDPLMEPQDLSLADYSRYGAAPLPDAHAAEAAGGPHTSPRIQAAGKLSCDICGLSCVSINVLLVHKRSHTGERPFHCSQCGASFTQKGNLLRHIKLHSGEKPFKCPMCSYACRRRDALSGHLRTHSVEKPFKCTHCSRSYKQRSSLEEHRERCHVLAQSRGPAERDDTHVARTPMGSERALLLDRLASNVAKRKSSMPQKFTGDTGVCLDLSFNRELIHRADIKEPTPASPGPEGVPAHRPYPPIPLHPTSSLTNGHKMGMTLLGLPQPVDSFSDSPQMNPPVMYTLGHLLGALNHHNGLPAHPHAEPVPVPLPEALREAGAASPPGAVYPCGHCRVLFLDYVMFTIHMGCHGFRDPLECNVCGHRSRDRYEFSSHIARGEHRLELK